MNGGNTSALWKHKVFPIPFSSLPFLGPTPTTTHLDASSPLHSPSRFLTSSCYPSLLHPLHGFTSLTSKLTLQVSVTMTSSSCLPWPSLPETQISSWLPSQNLCLFFSIYWCKCVCLVLLCFINIVSLDKQLTDFSLQLIGKNWKQVCWQLILSKLSSSAKYPRCPWFSSELHKSNIFTLWSFTEKSWLTPALDPTPF